MSGRGDVANVDSAGRNVLAIDIGSSSVRAGVADATGKLFSTERRAPAMREQSDAGDLAVEFDPQGTPFAFTHHIPPSMSCLRTSHLLFCRLNTTPGTAALSFYLGNAG